MNDPGVVKSGTNTDDGAYVPERLSSTTPDGVKMPDELKIPNGLYVLPENEPDGYEPLLNEPEEYDVIEVGGVPTHEPANEYEPLVQLPVNVGSLLTVCP